MCVGCLKGKELKEKGFIIGVYNTITTEEHGAESELNFWVIRGTAQGSGGCPYKL